MKDRKTAAELLAELQSDPDFQLKQAAKDAELRAREAGFALAEAPLISDLKQAGVEVSSVWDLVNTATPYPKAVPVLLKHLDHAYPERVLEGIVRALAVPEAATGWQKLLRLFKDEPEKSSGGIKWAAGCALSGAANEENMDDVLRLVSDASLGFSRAALLPALKRSKLKEAADTLIELEADPLLAKEVKKLRRMSRLKSR